MAQTNGIDQLPDIIKKAIEFNIQQVLPDIISEAQKKLHETIHADIDKITLKVLAQYEVYSDRDRLVITVNKLLP